MNPRPAAAKTHTDASPERAPLLPFSAEEFRGKLGPWYRKNARVLPWRGIRNPYPTWLSEIMLQQTRVAAVIERYTEFLKRFPTIAALAEAEEADVLALWSGLGYYRRARMLHRGAQFVMRELGGKLPRRAAQLRTLPGVGEYTAAAIASIAFREQVAVLDGNVERVLLRIIGEPETAGAQSRARLVAMAQELVPAPGSPRAKANPPGDHNQAMMELGATICLPRAPLCMQCPVVEFCKTRGEHVTLERGQQQSRSVAYLLVVRKRGIRTEVLLERRPGNASLMPGMLELPQLPLDAVEGREPVLRVRHAITNTNYYVMVFAESAAGAVPPEHAREDEDEDGPTPLPAVSVPVPRAEVLRRVTEVAVEERGEASLLEAVPLSQAAQVWVPTSVLAQQPLTGLARKILQRVGVMAVPNLLGSRL